MFARHAKLSARARVVSSEESRLLRGSASPGGHGHSEHTTLHLRVVPDGQREFASTLVAWGDVSDKNLYEGHWTYVLYDPDSPDECDIDKGRLEKEFGRLNALQRRVAVPGWASEARSTSPAPAAEPPPPTG
jgi:hypothetical protein